MSLSVADPDLSRHEERPRWPVLRFTEGCGVSDIGHSVVIAFAIGSRHDMPRISRFLGITIVMHYDDHPPPHFHVHYGGDGGTMDIDTMRLTDGHLLPRVLGLITEWRARNRDALLDNFDRCLNHRIVVEDEAGPVLSGALHASIVLQDHAQRVRPRVVRDLHVMARFTPNDVL